MSEKPINLHAHEVRAILDGRQTMLRRVMRPQPSEYFNPSQVEMYHPAITDKDGYLAPGAEIFGCYDRNGEDEGYKFPFGKPGDLLWVRETSIIAPKHFATPDDSCIPDADGAPRYIQYLASQPNTEAAGWYKLKKTPSIFMPRWASRITLEIVSVRVERVQDISEEDAVRHGVERLKDDPSFWHDYYPRGEKNGLRCSRSAKSAYTGIWDSINAKRGFGWDANPFVWVIEFRRVEKGVAV